MGDIAPVAPSQPLEITVKCDCDGESKEGSVDSDEESEEVDIENTTEEEGQVDLPEDIPFEEELPVSDEMQEGSIHSGDAEADELMNELERIKDDLLSKREGEGEDTYQLNSEIVEYLDLTEGLINKLSASPDEYIKDQVKQFVSYFKEEDAPPLEEPVETEEV